MMGIEWDYYGIGYIIYIYIHIYLGKFHHDLTVLPNPGIMVFIWEIIPSHGRTIQVSEILQFTQKYIQILDM